MRETTFPVPTRRASLKGLAAAALLAAVPSAAGAGKAGKKAKKVCKQQGEPCRDAFAQFCDDAPTPQTCFAAVRECCGFLERCNAGKAVECILAEFVTD